MFATLLCFLALQTAKIELGSQIIAVEIAETDQERAQGLKGRRHLPESHGMLFVFDEEQIVSFWMKETLLPLSIAFFDKEHVLFQVADMPPQELTAYQSRAPALYALEMPLHWFRDHKIISGMKFSFYE